MPPIFLFSAIISGIALLVMIYVISCRVRKVPVDMDCLKGMSYALWGFMMFALLLEGVEFASMVYRGREGIETIMEYVHGPLVLPFWTLQIGIGSAIPLLLLTFMAWRGTRGTALYNGLVLSAMLVLFSVLMMRWNVVIGGQEIAKTGKGLLTYHAEIIGRESLLTSAFLLVAPFILLLGAVRLLPPWEDVEVHAPLSA